MVFAQEFIFLHVILVYVKGLVHLSCGVLACIYVDVREQFVGAGFHSSPSEFQYLRIGNQAWTQPHFTL